MHPIAALNRVIRTDGFVIATLSILSGAPGSRASEVSFHKVALTGEAAPGTETGTVFATFTTPLNHSIMRPAIDELGNVAFIALLAGPAVDDSNRSGIWSDAAGPLGLVVRTGMPAPGTPPGIVFSGVPSEYLPFPPKLGGGHVAFAGELSGPGITFANQFGVWAQQSDPVVLIARNGDPAPGQPAGVLFGQASLFGIDSQAHTQLTASLFGAGITTANNESIWSNRSGALEAIVREGDPAPGTPPGVVIGLGTFGTSSTFPRIAFNKESRLFVAANLLGPDVDAFNDEGLFLEDETGVLTLLAREGDPAPGGGQGVTYGGGSVLTMFDGLSINALGQVAFSCRLGGAIPTTPVTYTTVTGELELLVLSGDPAPPAFGAPILSDAGKLAVVGFVPDGDNDFHTVTTGIWWDQLGTMAPLVLPGDTVAHPLGDLTVHSAGQIIGFGSTGVLAFRAALNTGAGNPIFSLLLADPQGGLHHVVGTGELFDVAGDGSDLREIVRIEPGGLSDGGRVAFRLDFTDGSSGHFTAQLEASGDADADGDVDLADYALLAACLTGPNSGPAQPSCATFDFEPDADIDLRDSAAFTNTFSGQ